MAAATRASRVERAGAALERWSIRWRWLVIAASLAATLAVAWGAGSLGFAGE